MRKQCSFITEGNRVMGKETIIFFENLGFGWVFDHTNLVQLNLDDLKDDMVVNDSLMKIIENILLDNIRY